MCWQKSLLINFLIFFLFLIHNVNKMCLPTLALRAGYNYGKSPLDANRAFENIGFPAIAEHHITAGVGLNLSQKFTFNLAAMYVPEAKLTGGNPSQFIASSTTTMSQLAFDGAVAYQF